MKQMIRLLLTLTFFLNPLSHAGDWPVFKKNMARDGEGKEMAYPSLTECWRYDNIQGEVRSSPVISEGTLFVGSRDGSVWAFNANDGRILWQYSTGDVVDASPAVANGFVYVPSTDGKLYAFKVDNGEDPAWTYTSGSKDMSSPVVYQGRVYWTTGFPNRHLIAVNAQSGELIWQKALANNSLSSPAIEGGLAIVGSNDGTICAFDAVTGENQWIYQTNGRVEFSSVAGDGQGYIYAVTGGDDPNLHAVKASTGELKEGFPVALVDLSPGFIGKPASEVSSTVVANGNVYVAMTGLTAPDTMQLQLFCRRTSDGTEVWSPKVIGTSPGQLGYASTPAIANDALYIGSGDGKIYMFNAKDGTALGTHDLGSPIVSSPAVSNGKIYVGTLAGHIYALQAEKVVSISYPVDGQIVGGVVDVKGVVTDPNLQDYTLEYGVGASPESWAPIATQEEGTTTTAQSVGQWDTTALAAPQVYTLRLSMNTVGGSNLNQTSFATLSIDASFATAFIIASAGGTLEATDTTKLVIPAGAMNQDDTVTISQPSTVPQAASLPAGTAETSIYREMAFASINTKLVLPATFTIPYTTDEISGADPSKLKLFFWDGSKWVLQNNSFANTTDKTVISLISKPGIYRVMEHRMVDTDQAFVYISPDGAEIHVEAGTFSQADSVSVTKHNSGSFFNEQPSNTEALPEAWEFLTGKPDTKFNKLVTIKIPYDPAALQNIPQDKLRVYLWYPNEQLWRIVNGSTVEKESQKICVKVSHFSVYRGFAFNASGPLLEKDKVYTYPNPAKGETVTFKTALGDDAVITIDVFNVAGERIVELVNSGTAGNVIETVWDIQTIASGVYIYRVEAKSSSGAKADVTKKLAIIH